MTISRVGTATGTTTATIPAHVAGDLIIIAAFRNTTGTPALGAGFTSILTRTGTTSSMRVGYKVATSTADTSGTWTNATALVCHVYRSSNYATGGSLYIGGSANNVSTTNTVNYPALTLVHTDGTSWALGFAGVGNLTETIATAPSGMTNQSLETATATQCAGHDTNGAVSSWASTNATTTGTAGNSVSATVELIENQPGTAVGNIIQHVSTSYNSIVSTVAGNNFAVPLPNPSLSGNGLVCAVMYPSGATPAITDNQSNTWPASGAAGTVTADAGAGGMALQIFRLASATAGTSTVTVGFGSTVQQPVKVWLTELYNITGTVNGSVQAANVNTAGIVSPGSFTPTNNNINGGNLILSYMCDSATSGGTNPALFVAETGYALNDADISWSQGQGNPNASQFWLQATSAATVPRFYLNAGGTDTYNVAAIALAVGTQGTPKPAGIHIDRRCYFAVNSGPTAWLLQIPSTGNLGVLRSFLPVTIGSPRWTAAADNNGTSWVAINPSGGAPGMWYNANQTPRFNRTVTTTINSAAQILQCVYDDISGAATVPLDVQAAVGQTTASTLSSISGQPSITPTGQNELVLAFLQVGVGPTTGPSVPAGAVYDLPSYQVAQFTATIAATALSVSATAWGTIRTIAADGAGTISGSGVSAGTVITTGTTPNFTVSISQTVSSPTTMVSAELDSDTMCFGNSAGHYYNGTDTTAESWTWNISNIPVVTGNTVSSVAAAFKAAPTTTVTTVLPLPETYVPRRQPPNYYLGPTSAFVAIPSQVLGWTPAFPDLIARRPPNTDAPFTAWTPQTIAQALITGWYGSQDYVPKKPATLAHFEPFTAFGTPPRIVTGWTPVFADAVLRRPGSPDFPFLAWDPQTIAQAVVMGWLPSADYMPRRPATLVHFEPFTAFGQPPRITTGWGPIFADLVARRPFSPDFPFLAWDPQTIAQVVAMGWLPSADYVPQKVTVLHLYPTAATFTPIPPQVTGWSPTFPDFVLRRPASADFPFAAFGQPPIAPPAVVIMGWLPFGIDFVPAPRQGGASFLAASGFAPFVPPFVPPPTPTVQPGEFRVSGSEVRDRFPTLGVVYDYAAITRRTN